MTRKELNIDGIVENATVVHVYPEAIVLEFDSDMGCLIGDNTQIAQAFSEGDRVQVISTSDDLGANILAVGHTEKDEWYKV